MNTNQILCFLTVARLKNHSTAASELFLTQQAVSRQILNLEQELNTRLFTRENGKTELTEAGQYYQKLFSTWSNQLQALREENLQKTRQSAIRLSIGCSDWLDPFGELGRGIAHFQTSQPQIRIDLQPLSNENLLEQLSRDALDLAIMPGDQCPQDSSLQQVPLAAQRMCFFVPAGTVRPTMDPQCWSLPFLAVPAWNWNPLEWTRISRQELAELGLTPKQIITLPDVASLHSSFRQGASVTLADDRFSPLAQETDALRFPLDTKSQLTGLWKKHRHHPALDSFTRALRCFFADGDKAPQQ